jgi:hypothetical protein
MEGLKTPKRTSRTHKVRRSWPQPNDSVAWADCHPIGGLECYTPADVQAEQMREEAASSFELRARKCGRPQAVTEYLSVDG